MSDSINIETVQEIVAEAIENSIANEHMIDAIDTQSTIEDDTQDPREKGARLIVPGFHVPNGQLKDVLWPQGTGRPNLKELRNEIKIRNPSSTPSHYGLGKCMQILQGVPYLLNQPTIEMISPRTPSASNTPKKNQQTQRWPSAS